MNSPRGQFSVWYRGHCIGTVRRLDGGRRWAGYFDINKEPVVIRHRIGRTLEWMLDAWQRNGGVVTAAKQSNQHLVIQCGVCGRSIRKRRVAFGQMEMGAVKVPQHVLPRTGRQCPGTKQGVRVVGSRIYGLLPNSTSSVRDPDGRATFRRFGGLRIKKGAGVNAERVGDWFLTTKGAKWFPLDPDGRAVDIEDIAWGLARLPRWAGHINPDIPFYSVAHHSVYTSIAVERYIAEPDRSLRLASLLHDVAEMYTGIGDVAGPNKARVYINVARNPSEPKLVTIRELESAITRVVFQALNVEWPDEAGWKKIKQADEMLLVSEARDFKSPLPDDWRHRVENGYAAYPHSLDAAGPRQSYDLFMMRYQFLKGE